MTRERYGNGSKGRAATSRKMHAIYKGYQGSEKKRRPAAKYSFFGGKRWD